MAKLCNINELSKDCFAERVKDMLYNNLYEEDKTYCKVEMWFESLNEKVCKAITWRFTEDDDGVSYDISPEVDENEVSEDDNVNHPSHYCKGGIECIDAIKASMSGEGFAGYCKGNILKYVWRHEDKNGTEDLRKAAVYLKWLIEAEEANDGEDNTTASQ